MGIPLPVLTYHYITFKHFQPWSAIGLQQGMYHIIKFVLLRSRNAIPVVLSEEKRKLYCGVNNGAQLHSNRQFRPGHWLKKELCTQSSLRPLALLTKQIPHPSSPLQQKKDLRASQSSKRDLKLWVYAELHILLSFRSQGSSCPLYAHCQQCSLHGSDKK